MHNLITNLQKLRELGAIEAYPESPDLDYVISLAEDLEITIDQLIYEEVVSDDLPERISQIKMLVMDCDGVLTDGGMYFTKNGDEIKRFNAKDGLGIKTLMKMGYQTGIISAGISTGLVEKRAEMLGVPHVYVGKDPKLEILEGWLKELDLTIEQVAYIGDDLTDLPILEKAGLAACPSDAALAVREQCDIVLETAGGAGCIRELVDQYLIS
ncbi:MAG: KdsC family phosphatase [Owenweeksia sp.]